MLKFPVLWWTQEVYPTCSSLPSTEDVADGRSDPPDISSPLSLMAVGGLNKH